MKSFLQIAVISAVIFISSFATASTTSPNAVRAFVYDWFALFDQNAPVDQFLDRLSADDLKIQFPERTLTSHEDFRSWYDGILTTYSQATHDINSLTVSPIDATSWNVDLVVLWQAIPFSGESVKFLAHQVWRIEENAEGKLQIKSYVVEAAPPLAAAAKTPTHTTFSSAMNAANAETSNLTCTCYGGPGNYPSPCAPIRKTCYGGPGNYPYECSVCPE